jgi:HEAT repeat protein
MAIEAIAKTGDISAIPRLIEMLSDLSAEVRFWSTFALGSFGAVEAIPELTRLANTDHEVVPGWHSVSQEAADALANISRSEGA